jgi:hypothetical protein
LAHRIYLWLITENGTENGPENDTENGLRVTAW